MPAAIDPVFIGGTRLDEEFARLLQRTPAATDEEMERFPAECEPVELEPDLSLDDDARLRQRWQSKRALS
ncbi:MAG TPA: hypothetical protein PLD20_22940 [Blastocatellia bacterium]|nr:hypothetical protein [Blastocatellia bacterium]HMX26313.1 hypothetical protein [Blastocatellia bacterium]HMY76288.1 hypothetical protein [Blastocatellia bacterium]HMZ20809.1 hypothetical protein [Blastocatellia bacterium]HNG31940.1 hypothetical protein [Blastocatellia bacterium]